MRPAIGGFHIFSALRLVAMPSPYITEITPEMQQKIKIFAEKGVPAPKSQKRTSLPPPNANPRCSPARGWHTGRRPPAVPAGKRTSGSLRRLRRRACGPPRPSAQPRPHARGGMCEGRTIGGSSLRIQSGQRLSNLRKGMRSPRHQKRTPPPQRTSLPPRKGRDV